VTNVPTPNSAHRGEDNMDLLQCKTCPDKPARAWLLVRLNAYRSQVQK